MNFRRVCLVFLNSPFAAVYASLLFSRSFSSSFLVLNAKPKLLVMDAWALGDLVLATPFLNAAVQNFDLTILARPIALDLQPLLWPGVAVEPFVFPWTAFRGKYRLYSWPWRELTSLVRKLRASHFDIAASARFDPRDHLFLAATGIPRRIGFPRLCSNLFLTDRLPLPPPTAHRYENWRALGRHLGFELPPLDQAASPRKVGRTIVVHCGAAQPTRVWPLDRFQFLVQQLRTSGQFVIVVCDPAQRSWWEERGEKVFVPGHIAELKSLLDDAGFFIGNDSGPGHLAGMMGIPTFTLFGNQFPGRFHPVGPSVDWLEGAPCPFKPCYDSCRFASPECLYAIGQEEAWLKVKDLAAKYFGPPRVAH